MADEEPARDAEETARPNAQPLAEADGATKERAEPPADGADVESEEKAAEEAASRTDNYITMINHMSSDAVVIGGKQIRPVRSSRKIGVDEIARTLRFFYEPPAFEKALRQLATNHLVVLCGAEGSGRWCAALRLLDDPKCPGLDRERHIEQLAPDTQLADLRDHGFVRGGRYLLTDLSTSDKDAKLRFDTTALRDRVRDKGAFLVVTSSTGTSAFGSSAVEWTATRVSGVLDTYARAARWSPEHIASVRELVATLSLHRLSEFIELVERDGLEAANTEFGEKVLRELRTWLDGGTEKPRVPDLVPLITAALIPNAVEHEHERRADELRAMIDDHAERDRSAADYVDTLRASRSARCQFVCRKADARSPAVVVGLATNLPADSVLAELRERYGDELWTPIRAWLDLQPSADLRIAESLAHGMEALRQVDANLTERVLNAWAAGDDHHRWAAASANSRLCSDRRSVRIALNQAIRWASGTTPAERITAVYAFSLGLSMSEPRQAISRLWNLTLRDVVVARYARSHLAALARRAADTGALRRVLAVVEHQLTHLIAEVPDDSPLIGRALTSVDQVLAVRTADDTPLTVVALDADSDSAEWLGQLWAQVLRGWSHRPNALDNLHAAYTRLTDTSKAALGTAMHRRMSPMEWQWLCRDLGIELRTWAGRETDVLEAAE